MGLGYYAASFMEGFNGLHETVQALKETNEQIDSGDENGYYKQYLMFENCEVQQLDFTPGYGTIEVLKKTFELNERGAKAGNPFAQFNYSILLLPSKRYDEHLYWMRNAATSGIWMAQAYLVQELATGNNTNHIDLNEAEYFANMSYETALQLNIEDFIEGAKYLIKFVRDKKNGLA